MKTLKFVLLLGVLCTILLTTQSCKDECADVVCQNGGICVDGTCDCSEWYTGNNCEEFDSEKIQSLLDGGKTPIELFNDNAPLESLYGKMYAGGLIFYLNETDGTGLVAATIDQSFGAKWGCLGIDIQGLNNANILNPPNPETEDGAKVGDGKSNTDTILDLASGCNEEGIAAKLCRDLGEDWFLPSRGELTLMYTNLHKNGHGGFSAAHGYWNSTEFDNNRSWTQYFGEDNRFSFDVKQNDNRVRAARAF